MVTLRCLVAGRVQGVHYRASAARHARERGLRGVARNLPDGRVEVLVGGAEAAVEDFVAWLWIGPSAAKVTAVEIERLDPLAAELPQGFLTG
jgi:acylphosphatase